MKTPLQELMEYMDQNLPPILYRMIKVFLLLVAAALIYARLKKIK